MARNGTGTYSLPAGNPVVTGTTISSTVQNNTMNDIATALTASIAADGQTPVTANIPMNSKKLTGLAAATTSGDALSFGQTGMGALPGTRLTASTGIDVGNSAQTGNILDWYEEASLSLSMTGASGAPISTPCTGAFTRIGNRVFLDLLLSAANFGTAAGAVRITGLPYAAAADTVFNIGYGEGSTASVNCIGSVTTAGGTTTIFLKKLTGADLLVSDISFSLANLTGFYRV